MYFVITLRLWTPLYWGGWGGHLGVRRDIYYNILVGMFIGYAIFHRSVPIIRAWHSQRAPLMSVTF